MNIEQSKTWHAMAARVIGGKVIHTGGECYAATVETPVGVFAITDDGAALYRPEDTQWEDAIMFLTWDITLDEYDVRAVFAYLTDTESDPYEHRFHDGTLVWEV